MQLLQTWDFFGGGSDHQLAALLVRTPVLGTEALHRGAAGHAIPGFERASSIVKPRVDNSGVVSRLMGCNPIFLLYDHEAMAGEPSRVFQRGSKSNNARADYEEVGLTVGHNACPMEGNIIGSEGRKRM